MTVSSSTIRLIDIAAGAADARGGTDILALDVSGPLPLVDAFVLVTGQVERTVMAIASEIEDRINDAGVRTLRREGKSDGRWILLDFGDLVVHVFHEEDRLYYSLERLWKDCPVILVALTESLVSEPSAQSGAVRD